MRKFMVLTSLVLSSVLLNLSLSNIAQAMPFEGHHILVAGPSPDSPAIAREIYQKGGNAIDAAVAIEFGLSVTQPYFASLGGGGFAMIKMNGKVQALDFRETAPKAVSAELYKNLPIRGSIDGALAVGTPGVVAGLWALHQKYGKLKWSALLQPAIRLADGGIQVSGEFAELSERNEGRFNKSGLFVFRGRGKTALRSGDRIQQHLLANALRLIAFKGEAGFYQGPVAKDLVDTLQMAQGKITLEDLKNYRVRWLKPLETDYAGHHLYLMPPPSSGGVVMLQAFKLMEKLKMSEKKPLSVDEFHGLIEIMKLSYQGRALLGDPDFAKNPIAELTSDSFLQKQADLIHFDRSIDSTKLGDLSFANQTTEKGETTNFSLIDKDGNAVAFTVTLNGDYGSGIVTNAYGIALNNEMDDFMTHPGKPNMFGLIQGDANAVRPGARPLSSMSPLIAEKNGVTRLAIGSPGGPRIISAVFQTVHRILAQKMDVERAIYTPRVHHQFLPNIVRYDAWGFTPETLAALEKRGHKMDPGSTAKVYAVERLDDGTLRASADRRGEGAAGGF
jgi:gamma-glutamyltranspeptidase/glutathione hydrolase